jgi:hypothetical protein
LPNAFKASAVSKSPTQVKSQCRYFIKNTQDEDRPLEKDSNHSEFRDSDECFSPR